MQGKNKYGEYLLLFLAIAVFLFLATPMSVLAASTEIGPFKQGSRIQLIQVCDNCTFVNLTYVQHPDSTIENISRLMTKYGSYYNYSYQNTGQQGTYKYTTCGDADGVYTCQSVDFLITPSGYNNYLGITIVVIVAIYGIALFGFFGKNEWLSIIGGMGLILLGLFTLNNGIDIFRNFMTEAFSYLTISIGALFSITAGISIIEENL